MYAASERKKQKTSSISLFFASKQARTHQGKKEKEKNEGKKLANMHTN
jgi:hypothetical protein